MSSSTVINEVAVQAHRIHAQGEYALIVMIPFDRDGRRGGELAIHSSFGSWGEYWPNTGAQFPQFLAGCDVDYLIGRLGRGERREFDFEVSLARWKREVLRARHRRDLTQDEANDVWNETVFMDDCSADVFTERLSQASQYGRESGLFERLADYIVTRPNTMLVNFCEVLWKPFVQQVLAQPQTAEVTG